LHLQQSGMKNDKEKLCSIPNEQKIQGLRLQGVQYIGRFLSGSIVYTLVLIISSSLSILSDVRLIFSHLVKL